MGAIRRRSFEDPDDLRETPLLTVAFESQGAKKVKGMERPIEVYRLG